MNTPDQRPVRRTALQAHLELFGQPKQGCGSALCGNTHHIVLGKGQLPCDFLFVGEAPGKSEDALGRPFVGPAGKLLDTIIRQAGLTPYRLAYTNLIGCVPKDTDGLKSTEPPSEEAITCCQPRLADYVRIARPRCVVRVGKLAQEWVGSMYRHSLNLKVLGLQPKLVDLDHPAFLLRASYAVQGVLVQRAVITLEDALEELDA